VKKYTPKLLIKYLLKEFSFSLLVFFIIFSSLIILSTYIEEIIFFRDKEITNNFFFKIFVLSIIKSPTLILNLSPFIFLFSGIFFYVKFLKNNEIATMSISGFSKNFITLVPSLYSFVIGILLITIFTPVTSELSKYYESVKRKYSDNENLLIMSETGIWIKEKKDKKKFIIRTDKINESDFLNLKNISIYVYKNDQFIERIVGKNVQIIGSDWNIKDVKIISEKENKNLDNFIHKSQINLGNLQEIFINSDTFSIWNMQRELAEIRERGYYGQEIIIKFNKYLSLPFLLFAMVFLSTVFTLNINYTFNNFIYAFFGIFSGIIVYFMGDLSIALGKSGKIPMILSVWMPILLIMIFSTYSLLKNNE